MSLRSAVVSPPSSASEPVLKWWGWSTGWWEEVKEKIVCGPVSGWSSIRATFCAFRPMRLADLSRYALSAAMVSCREVDMHRGRKKYRMMP